MTVHVSCGTLREKPLSLAMWHAEKVCSFSIRFQGISSLCVSVVGMTSLDVHAELAG